jgi:hypothetical protein
METAKSGNSPAQRIQRIRSDLLLDQPQGSLPPLTGVSTFCRFRFFPFPPLLISALA